MMETKKKYQEQLMIYLKHILDHNRRKLAKCGDKERDIEE